MIEPPRFDVLGKTDLAFNGRERAQADRDGAVADRERAHLRHEWIASTTPNCAHNGPEDIGQLTASLTIGGGIRRSTRKSLRDPHRAIAPRLRAPRASWRPERPAISSACRAWGDAGRAGSK